MDKKTRNINVRVTPEFLRQATGLRGVLGLGSNGELLRKLMEEGIMSTEEKIALGRGAIAREAAEVFGAYFESAAPTPVVDACRFVDERNLAGCNVLWRLTVDAAHEALADVDDSVVVRFEADVTNRVVGKLPRGVTSPGVWSMAVRELVGETRWARIHAVASEPPRRRR